jgi:hypothetical protein
MEWRGGGVEQNGRRKRGDEREREGAPGSSSHAKFLLSPFRSSSLGSLPDTEFEPAATTARQTPMKAKTEERAILAVEKRR